MHAAFKVDSRAKVDAFHKARASRAAAATKARRAARAQYHPNYYGAYVRDPDGNKLQAVCHRKDG